MMGRKDKSDIRKPEILDHLQRVMATEGIEGTTLAKVAKSMGVNSGLLIHYFKSKEEMIIAMVDRLVDIYGNLYLQKLAKYEAPEARLEFIMDTIFKVDPMLRENDSVFYACYVMSFRNNRIRSRFKHMFDRFRAQLSKEIESFINAGIVKVTDPVKTADIMITVIEGINFYRTMLVDDDKIEETAAYFENSIRDLLNNGETDTPNIKNTKESRT
ncbi:MAG: TetR family transcriptional regulator [Desulfobacterales bacterium]|nr:TetR family transcriptional regulator [Desulfobacterales bacterium]